MKKTLLSLLVGASFFSQADVEYKIDFVEPEHHFADVSVRFPANNSQYMDVKLPAWRTGKYKILDLANGIREFSAQDSNGNPLNWYKIDKSTWRVEKPQQGVVVNYELYANQLGTRTRHIDDSHAYLDAASALVYSPSSREQALTVELAMPDDWKSISGMAFEDNKFVAANYDVLVDSPIEAGVHKRKDFSQDGKDYSLVVWGEGNYNFEQMAQDLNKLVAQGSAIWDGYPYDNYVFMVHATSGVRGATEHLNSTIIQRDRFTFAPREKYLEFLSTASHEFVHTWNVKAYRPDGLAPYDYQAENYSNLLWISEGSTSYFQDQLLLRAGLMKPEEFFKKLARRIDNFNHKPGKTQQTVAESSFNAWIDEGGDRGNNASVNIYSEGFLTSWLLDLDMLQTTDAKRSYRDLHNGLYQEFRLPHGFTEQNVLTLLKKYTGKDYASWWKQNVHGNLSLDFDAMLNALGLEYKAGKEVIFTGMRFAKGLGGVSLSSVEKGSAAWRAGLTPGDILVAVNDVRLRSKGWDALMESYQAGDEVTLTYFRRDKLQTTKMKLVAGRDKGKVVAMANPSDKQKAMFKAWMGIALPTR